MIPHDARLYGSIEAAKEVGVSLRQLYYWVDILRVVQPQMRQSGLRRFRRFTVADLRTLKEMRTLVDCGYTVQAALRMVKSVREDHGLHPSNPSGQM